MSSSQITEQDILRRADAIRERNRVSAAYIPHQQFSIPLVASSLGTEKASLIQCNPSGSVEERIAAEVFRPLLEAGIEEYKERLNNIAHAPMTFPVTIADPVAQPPVSGTFRPVP